MLRDKYIMELPEKKIKLRSLNPHIVCLLCAGYLVEATTIIECLHTFCKSCIVRYLQSSKYCPTCGTLVHETEPLSNITLDRKMQDIMEKILPNITVEEKRREVEFLKNIRKEETRKDLNNIQTIKEKINLSNFTPNYRYNEQFNLCLELDHNGLTKLDEMEVVEIHNKYIRCPGRVKILHLKKLIRKFYEPYCSKFELKIQCHNHELDDMDHLKLIYTLYWERKPQPIILYYGFEKCNNEVKMIIDDCISKVESSQTNNDMEDDTSTILDTSLNVDEKDENSPEIETLNVSINLSDVSTDTADISSSFCSDSSEVNTGESLEPSLDTSETHDNLDTGICNNASVSTLDSLKSFSGKIVNNSLRYTSNIPCLAVT